MMTPKARRGILAPLLVLALAANALAPIAWIMDISGSLWALWAMSVPENLWVAWLVWGRRGAARGGDV